MKMFKRIISLVFAIIMLVSCVACSDVKKYDDFASYIKNKYTQDTAIGDRNIVPPAENGGSILEDLFGQTSFYTSLYDVITKLDFSSLGKFAYNFGFKEFYSPVVDYIKGEPEESKPKDPNTQKILQDLKLILSKLDSISKNQDKMIAELGEVSKLVECEQLNNVLNNFQQLANNKLAPLAIYEAIRYEEEDTSLTDEERRERIMSDLLGGMGFGEDYRVYNRTDVAFDTYTYNLGQAIIGPYRVSFKNDKSVQNESGNIFWIYYELKRHEVDWEHQADEDRATFHNDLLSQYLMAATVDIQSLNARIAAIKEYNDNRAQGAPYVSDTNVKQMLNLLIEQMKAVGTLAQEWDVQPHEYRYFWVSGHEVKIMPEIKCGNFKTKHTENKAAGIDDNLAIENPNEYFKDYMQYDETHPLISGEKLAALYKFVGQSGRLNAYKSSEQPFWDWLVKEGGITIDSNVDTYFALISPLHSYMSDTEGATFSSPLDRYRDLCYDAFSPHYLALTTSRYYDEWKTWLVYGIKKYNQFLPTNLYEFDYSPYNFDNHNFMIIGTVAEN